MSQNILRHSTYYVLCRKTCVLSMQTGWWLKPGDILNTYLRKANHSMFIRVLERDESAKTQECVAYQIKKRMRSANANGNWRSYIECRKTYVLCRKLCTLSMKTSWWLKPDDILNTYLRKANQSIFICVLERDEPAKSTRVRRLPNKETNEISKCLRK